MSTRMNRLSQKRRDATMNARFVRAHVPGQRGTFVNIRDFWQLAARFASGKGIFSRGNLFGHTLALAGTGKRWIEIDN